MNYFEDWEKTTERIEPTPEIIKAYDEGLTAASSEPDTITHEELKTWLMADLRETDSIKRTYIHIAQESAKTLIQQRYGNIDPLPREPVKRIVQECIEMCVKFAHETCNL